MQLGLERLQRRERILLRDCLGRDSLLQVLEGLRLRVEVGPEARNFSGRLGSRSFQFACETVLRRFYFYPRLSPRLLLRQTGLPSIMDIPVHLFLQGVYGP